MDGALYGSGCPSKRIVTIGLIVIVTCICVFEVVGGGLGGAARRKIMRKLNALGIPIYFYGLLT
jgi:hypothetical protein